ncbi:hypothetical protein BFP97_06115 [Roseivirga sp. 4D4]|uniref:hypothetical protein n=1 Tax=Roseivirga sp. 4D4 TaxID=1889784 RepID=UPI000852AE43|nr:hypothetical protein [Roseivirga sp. 4D4]OEK01107.1 hypothetical protein BFP97_06115 [Roseivirga sp. 4D4]
MRFLFISFCSLFVSLAVFAQSTDELIAKNLEAMGGMPKLKSTENIAFFGTVTIKQGGRSTDFIFSQVMTKDGKMLFRLSNQLGRIVNLQGFDGVDAWVGTETRSKLMQGEAKLDFIHNAFLTRFMDRERHAKDIKLVSRIKQETELSMRDLLDRRVTIVLDNATNLITKESYQDLQGNFHVIRNSNFKTYDGLVLPSSIRVTQLPNCKGCSDVESDNKIVTMNYTVNEIVVNATGIDPKMFQRTGG